MCNVGVMVNHMHALHIWENTHTEHINIKVANGSSKSWFLLSNQCSKCGLWITLQTEALQMLQCALNAESQCNVHTVTLRAI